MASTAAAATLRFHTLSALTTSAAQSTSANNSIQFALIGAGIQGQGDTAVALRVPGVKLVAVADCYDGRLTHSKELWGTGTSNDVDLFTTRDYREILARKDIDAVIIATPDHWHKQAAVDAMHAGKDVYLEKPMIHLYSDGPEIIATAKSTTRILQVGSQRVSSVIYAKAKEVLASGAIGQLNTVTARWDRNSSLGALELLRPTPDASTTTCDWPRFLEAPPRKFLRNAERFFQWRKWFDYSSGVAGDLFVHTSSVGPTLSLAQKRSHARAMATGALRFWKDGRNVPDILLALLDYPEGFNLSLRVNFVDGGDESEGFLFTGSEGTMEIAGQTVTVTRVPRESDPGYTISTFANATQQEFLKQYREKYPPTLPTGTPYTAAERFSAPYAATPTASTTSRTSSTPSAPANNPSKTPPSASEPQEPPYSPMSASRKVP